MRAGTILIDKDRLNQIVTLINNKFDKNYTLMDVIPNENPFSASGTYELGDKTLLLFRYDGEDEFTMRIGKKSGWVGGLEWDECWFGGNLKSFSIADVKKCLDTYSDIYTVVDVTYCNPSEPLFEGTREECESWMIENGFEIKVNSNFEDTRETYHKFRYGIKEGSVRSTIVRPRVY